MEKQRKKTNRRRCHKRRVKFVKTVVLMLLVFVALQIKEHLSIEKSVKPVFVEETFLTPNLYSRPQTSIGRINNIFIHYTANPGTSAAQNRSYFEGLKDTGERSASAHFIIGYEGEVIQCIPLEEEAYAVKTRNHDSISIECCYLESDGSFTKETYDTLIALSAWLLQEYRLKPEDLLRHYDCGGKKCPLYYVENEAEWEQFKEDVLAYMGESN